MVTSKKQKFVGYKTLVDPETGETYPMQMNLLEDRDFNFHKVWLQHLVNSLDGITNQRLKLAFWIIDHLDRENKLTMTQRAIATQSGMSYQTVNRTMKALQEGSPAFLVKINSGAYRVNPDVIWKGSHSNRMGVCYQYVKDMEAPSPDPVTEQDAELKEPEPELDGQITVDGDGDLKEIYDGKVI